MIHTGRKIMQEMIYIESEEKCIKCKGTGKITVYRSDLEEFEEVECDLCITRD